MLVMLLPKSNVGDLIHAFIYEFKAHLYPLVKDQVVQMEAPSLAEVMTVAV